ncbi:hypothetical protein C8Q78DRAFT_716000 [Trametes maxima]|nr:hypothetical protein C8Q78DRAFT_716000 [Trametes maxima]
MSSAPWDIYAEQLTPLRYGYPLWVPDPSPGKPPVQLGDVGWIREGQFLPLFNVFRDADDNQPRGAVPSGFTPLNLSDITVEGPREKISQKVVCSRSIRQNDVSGGVGASGPSPSFPSWNVEFAFRCREDSGAFLVPYPSVMAHDILSKLRIEAYILSNFDSWLDFANSTLELGLKEEDLRFVCGRKMTIRWAVAAFQGRYRNKSGSITGALGAVTGSANLSMTISDESLPASHYRVGPPDPVPGGSQPTLLPEDGDSSNSPPAPSDVFNQCVFIHYYKRKKRLPFFPAALKASAGPHELPPCSDDSQAQMLLHGSSAASSAGDDISLSEYYASSDIFDDTPTVADPVDAILGYILENSDATVALSSDVDLHELLPDLVQWPDDLRNSLSDLKPVIDVNENGGKPAHFMFQSCKR